MLSLSKPHHSKGITPFNNRVRDECLNMNEFHSLLEARVVIEDWKEDYNNRRRQFIAGVPNSK
ncbi:integrase core domain-containing protein [Rhodococcus sp. KBS0724]|uniref:integrase core domain-containing protein n=1 Tax=Rhodococcus sp. KBS0724 TaxID=1179674 RepID=UPI00163DD9B9